MNSMPEREIRLIENRERVEARRVLEVDREKDLIACDFYVEGIERASGFVGGYRDGRIHNIDHHAPTVRMRRPVSSTNLALAAHAEMALPAPEFSLILISHVDCDSVLTAGILSGRLAPDERYGAAAIAADHTGEENDIADLLQALDVEQSRRGTRDVEYAFANLERWQARATLEESANAALETRRRRREAAEVLVRSGKFQRIGRVHVAELDDAIEGEFFPALVPEATAIVLASPHLDNPTRWQCKVRLGIGAPDGLSLSDVDITGFDPAYGGRWNAGSNRRGGGTPLPPEEYAANLNAALERLIRAGANNDRISERE
jgi:hypothetical protein